MLKEKGKELEDKVKCHAHKEEGNEGEEGLKGKKSFHLKFPRVRRRREKRIAMAIRARRII
jgi:hypothetical protein